MCFDPTRNPTLSTTWIKRSEEAGCNSGSLALERRRNRNYCKQNVHPSRVCCKRRCNRELPRLKARNYGQHLLERWNTVREVLQCFQVGALFSDTVSGEVSIIYG